MPNPFGFTYSLEFTGRRYIPGGQLILDLRMTIKDASNNTLDVLDFPVDSNVNQPNWNTELETEAAARVQLHFDTFCEIVTGILTKYQGATSITEAIGMLITNVNSQVIT